MTDLLDYTTELRRIAREAVTRASGTLALAMAQVELAGLGRTLRAAAEERAAVLRRGAPDETCGTLVNDLLPRRIGAAQMAADAMTREDANDLREFVEMARDLALAAIASADDVDEVCEAVGDALDSIHSFLLTHELVPESYLEDDREETVALGESTVGEPRSEEWDRVLHDEESEVERAEHVPVEASARKNDLALAA